MDAAEAWIVPPPIRPRSRLRVIAPSGAFDRALVLRGLGWLRERYRVEFAPGLFAKQGFLAGSDERRLDELDSALADPGIEAIVVARGGYGLTRIVHRAALEHLRRAPRWIVGFSDATALHVEAARRRVATLHAPNVAGLGRADDAQRRRWIEALEGRAAGATMAELATWRPGVAVGRLLGGNLTVLFTCAAAGRLRLPRGTILLLEDVTEQSYRLDRMLTALQVGGHLDGVAGFIVGELTDCPSGPHGVTAEAVLHERLGQLGVPVVAGAPVGHGLRNHPMQLGTLVSVDADRGTVTPFGS